MPRAKEMFTRAIGRSALTYKDTKSNMLTEHSDKALAIYLCGTRFECQQYHSVSLH